MPLEVILIDWARDPLQEALRRLPHLLQPEDARRGLGRRSVTARISKPTIREFIAERLKTGHASPLEQVVFWFGISGVSRSLSHQFVRHRIGISFEQQSQRYVRYREDRLDYVRPKTWDKAGLGDEYDRLMGEITRVYRGPSTGGYRRRTRASCCPTRPRPTSR